MRKSNLFLFLFLLLFLSCSQVTYHKLSIAVPNQPALDLSPYDQVAIADFLVTKSPEDLDANQQITDYFQSEFKMQLPAEVTHVSVSSLDEETFGSPDFWKALMQEEQNAIILTGRVGYQAETRKAFSSTDKRKLETPFPERTRIYQKGFFTLDMDVYLIEGRSGEILYQKTFKETQSLNNLNQRPSFALYELLNSVKVKLFRQITGGIQVQERYLLSR
jgi:hypothetical protein